MIASWYHPGNTVIHKADPRIKILLLVEVVILFFWPTAVFWYGLTAAVIMFLIILTAGLRSLWAAVKAILPLLVLVALLTPLFNRGGPALFTIGNISVGVKAAEETLMLILRFTGLTLIFYLFFLTTDLQHVILTLRWYGVPYTGALVITLAFRYIPTIAGLLGRVRDAHKLRNPAEYAAGSAKRRGLTKIRKFLPMLTSVVIASIKSIPVLAMSLEHRGIGSSVKRSSYISLPPLLHVPVQLAAGTVTAVLLSIPIWI